MKTIKKILALGALGIIFSLVVFVSVKPMVSTGATTVFTGGQTYYLAGSGITSISATSIALTSFTIPQTGYELTTADVAGVGGKFYITLEPGKTSKQEFISCTTVTQGAGTSAVISGCSRGLIPFTPYTASSTYAFTHVGGAPLIISNSPAFYYLFALKGNNETITGNWDYTANVTIDVDCTVLSANDEVCAKAYIDAQIASGVSDANPTTAGKVQIATDTQYSTLGSTGSYLVIPADSATTTSTANKLARMSGSGKLNQNMLNLSEEFMFASSTTFTASSTFTASTTLSKAIVKSTPTYSLEATSKNYVDLRTTSYAYNMGTITPISQTSGNNDNVTTYSTTTVDFTPRIIKLTYWGRGLNTGTIVESKGIIFYKGTTTASIIRLSGVPGGGDAIGSTYPGIFTSVASYMQSDVDNGDSFASLIFGGTGTNSAKITVTMERVTSTEFVLKLVRVSGSYGSSANLSFRATWEAWQ